MIIRHLYISPGHNYFGRYGKPSEAHPIVEVPELSCVAGRGLQDDRFFDYKVDYKGQVTFFSLEVFEEMARQLGVSGKTTAVLRRNVIVSDIDLNTLIGKEFEVQGVHFRGTEECRPCSWMDQAFAPGAEAFLKGRGGLRAMILTSGKLRVGPAAVG